MRNWIGYRTGLLVVGLVAGVAGGVLLLTASTTQAAPAEKVTICHAAGQDDTLHYITLNLSFNGVFGGNGQSGHFLEDGSTAAGHEHDTFGPCEEPSPSPTPTPGV